MYKNDVGIDIEVTETKILEPGETAVFKTTIAVKLNNDEMALVLPRSSTRGLHINHAPIDPGYEGMIHVIVTNICHQSKMILEGDKFCQIVKVKIAPWEQNESCEERGNRWNGSSDNT